MSGDVRLSHNPFATSRIRAGVMEFIYPEQASCAQLMSRLAQQHWRGAIVGPHGSGKSSLLAELLPACQAVGKKVAQHTLHDGEVALPRVFMNSVAWNSNTLIVIDGYEQLSRWWRAYIVLRTQWQRVGLLVTSHAPSVLPTILTLQPREEIAELLVRQLGVTAEEISPNTVAEAYRTARGNVRECLLLLYDIYELRMRKLGNHEK